MLHATRTASFPVRGRRLIFCGHTLCDILPPIAYLEIISLDCWPSSRDAGRCHRLPRRLISILHFPFPMKIFLLLLGALASVFVLFTGYRILRFRQAVRQISARTLARIQPLVEAFGSGLIPSAQEVYPYAHDLSTREATFRLLREQGHLELFPTQYHNLEAGAAANLAAWLEFPTELGRCPDEMEAIHQETIEVEGHPVHYHVFRFRVHAPAPKGAEGWRVGVVGPYFEHSQPYDHPAATFSRLAHRWEETDPAAEAQWVHAHVAMR